MTAVEWFYQKILSKDIKEVFEQAKEMEKEQITDAWDNGFANGFDLGKHNDNPYPDDAEQYYNETFK